jgi:hypothetical protein
MAKEKVIIFDDGTLETALLQNMFGDDYDFEKIKTKEFSAGDLTKWLEQVKDKGTPEERQKVFLSFNNEFSIANDIRKAVQKATVEHPNLSIAMMMEGMSADSIKERMGVRTDRVIERDIRRAIGTGTLKMNDEDIPAEIEKQRNADIEKALGKSSEPSPTPMASTPPE